MKEKKMRWYAQSVGEKWLKDKGNMVNLLVVLIILNVNIQ